MKDPPFFTLFVPLGGPFGSTAPKLRQKQIGRVTRVRESAEKQEIEKKKRFHFHQNNTHTHTHTQHKSPPQAFRSHFNHNHDHHQTSSWLSCMEVWARIDSIKTNSPGTIKQSNKQTEIQTNKQRCKQTHQEQSNKQTECKKKHRDTNKQTHLVRSIDGSSTLQSLVHSHTFPTVLYKP